MNITVEWPAVPNVPGYDLYKNGTKVSSTLATKAKFSVTNNVALKVAAQPVPAPIPAREVSADFGSGVVGTDATAAIS